MKTKEIFWGPPRPVGPMRTPIREQISDPSGGAGVLASQLLAEGVLMHHTEAPVFMIRTNLCFIDWAKFHTFSSETTAHSDGENKQVSYSEN